LRAADRNVGALGGEKEKWLISKHKKFDVTALAA
jgi:hypothetical protein